MQGCKFDTDGDGNCPFHPTGCRREATDQLRREILSHLNHANSRGEGLAHVETATLARWVKLVDGEAA